MEDINEIHAITWYHGSSQILRDLDKSAAAAAEDYMIKWVKPLAITEANFVLYGCETYMQIDEI